MMTMEPVHGSSNIKAIGHDPESKEMRVEFHSGKTYAYFGVHSDTHAALMSAPSKGGHFQKHIRACHECKPVTE